MNLRKFFVIPLSMAVLAGVCFGQATESHALSYTIDNAADLFDPVGDFIVSGYDQETQNYDVLQFRPKGGATSGTAYDGSSAPGTSPYDAKPIVDDKNGNVSVQDLWTFLNGSGIVSANSLFFGFDLNESGKNEDVTIEQLVIGFDGFDGHLNLLGIDSVIRFVGSDKTDKHDLMGIIDANDQPVFVSRDVEYDTVVF